MQYSDAPPMGAIWIDASSVVRGASRFPSLYSAFVDVARWHGGGWREEHHDPDSSIEAMWGASPDDIWAVSNHGAVGHWDGTRWSTVPCSAANGRTLNSLWGTSSEDLWAVGDGGVVVHWNGEAWIPDASQRRESLFSVWGFSNGDVWLAGDGGTILRRNAGVWEALDAPHRRVQRVWGLLPESVWFVGSGGFIARWDGTRLRVDRVGGNGSWHDLHDVWGAAPDDVWAVGNHGSLYHFDGATWTDGFFGVENDLRSVAGRSACDVWIVGARTILHRELTFPPAVEGDATAEPG